MFLLLSTLPIFSWICEHILCNSAYRGNRFVIHISWCLMYAKLWTCFSFIVLKTASWICRYLPWPTTHRGAEIPYFFSSYLCQHDLSHIDWYCSMCKGSFRHVCAIVQSSTVKILSVIIRCCDYTFLLSLGLYSLDWLSCVSEFHNNQMEISNQLQYYTE